MINHPENAEEYKGLTVNNGVSSQPTVNPYRKIKENIMLLTIDDNGNTYLIPKRGK